jgi:menaquinone-dependent protoporphyrinogen oxidase
MTVLVVVASKHGATRVIAGVIADTLNTARVAADVADASAAPDVTAYDAVVVGSAVYAGHWLPAARELVERQAGPMGGRPVWLFSSGPLGAPLKPEGDPVDVGRVLERTGARAHRVFGGRIDRASLGFSERAICAALRVPDGDFRPWPEIRAWAGEIATELLAGTTGGWEREVAASTR